MSSSPLATNPFALRIAALRRAPAAGGADVRREALQELRHRRRQETAARHRGRGEPTPLPYDVEAHTASSPYGDDVDAAAQVASPSPSPPPSPSPSPRSYAPAARSSYGESDTLAHRLRDWRAVTTHARHLDEVRAEHAAASHRRRAEAFLSRRHRQLAEERELFEEEEESGNPTFAMIVPASVRGSEEIAWYISYVLRRARLLGQEEVVELIPLAHVTEAVRFAPEDTHVVYRRAEEWQAYFDEVMENAPDLQQSTSAAAAGVAATLVPSRSARDTREDEAQLCLVVPNSVVSESQLARFISQVQYAANPAERTVTLISVCSAAHVPVGHYVLRRTLSSWRDLFRRVGTRFGRDIHYTVRMTSAPGGGRYAADEDM